MRQAAMEARLLWLRARRFELMDGSESVASTGPGAPFLITDSHSAAAVAMPFACSSHVANLTFAARVRI